MATLTVTTIDRDGVEESLTAAASGGDEFVNDGQTVFIVANANGSDSRTVTFVTQATVDGQAVGDKAVTVVKSSTYLVGPFPPNIYNDGDGCVQVTYSDSAADLTVNPYKI